MNALRISFCLLLAGSQLVPLSADEKPDKKEKPKSALTEAISIIDPDQDCEFKILADKLTITVPPTNHNLHPVRGMNAPRVLKKVSGDFTIQVKVTSDFLPGKKTTKAKEMGRPFNGAGILIWQNENNYLRVERNAYWVNDTLYCYPPLTEYWHNGQGEGFNNEPTEATYFTDRSTWLVAERKGNNMSVWISHDGDEMTQERNFEIKMEHDVLVGVAAINSSDTPFTVDFEEFTIIEPN